MSILSSSIFEVGTEQTPHNVDGSKSLMPVDGIVYVWYGPYTGTDEELVAEGMPIPSGKLLEHIQTHSGIITLIADSGTVTIHEVI